MTQASLCPQCGTVAVLKEQHRPDGTLPSRDWRNRRDAAFQPKLLCEKCIDDNLLAEAKVRRLRAKYGRVML